ncbi:MAG: tetratricopeptide repeat protein [Gemmatimonadaceae bacterium]|nr:tetratricopeptide repeat protein [Gemmatimonadaceae bacterium]
MAIKGSLKEASLPDVLQLLAMGKKTGCLAVTHRNNFGYIYFDKGRISYASIVNRRDRLGDILVKAGAISQTQLDAAISAQATHRDKRIGELLVAQGAITRDEMHEQIRLQIEEAVYFLFTWMQGSFNFEADVHPEEQDLQVSINPESLLLEGARRVDEWSLIEKKIPTFDLVFDIDRRKLAESGVALTREQETVLNLLDGRRDVAAVIDESGLGEFDVGKAIFGLLSAGFAQRVGKTKAMEPAVSDARVDEHRNLGIAFYKTGMLDEAMREFRRVIDLRDSDSAARFYVGLALARQGKWVEAEAAFRECTTLPGARASALHNLAYALERLGRFDDAQAALEEAIRRGGAKEPRIQTSVGVVALRAGDVVSADAALQVARPLFGTRPPTAAWFHYAALTAALLGDLDRATALLIEGVAAHPHSAPLHNNLAAVHERRGYHPEALAAAERGVMEDAGLPQLHKNLGDCHYRAARYDDALESYGRAVKLNPALGDDVYLKLGNIRFKRQERDEAVRCWEQALALAPDNAIVRTNLDAVRQVL